MAEALDYCGTKAMENYAITYELLGSKNYLLKKTLDIIKGKPTERKEFDLLSEFSNITYNKYLCY